MDELGRLGEALTKAETHGLPYSVDEVSPKSKHAPKVENRIRRVDPLAVAAIRLLIFTGGRLREILHARCDEIDFERGMLNLSTARFKDGKKGYLPFSCSPRYPSTLAPHRQQSTHYSRRGAGRRWHWPPRSGPKGALARCTTAAGLSGLRIHDLRHTFASIGAGHALGLHMVGKLLGHTQPTTTARYAHLDADPVRRAANTIGAAISDAMNRHEPAK